MVSPRLNSASAICNNRLEMLDETCLKGFLILCFIRIPANEIPKILRDSPFRGSLLRERLQFAYLRVDLFEWTTAVE